MDAREAKEMYDAVEKAGVRHQTAFNWRFCPAVQTAKKMVADGTLGRIYDFRGLWPGGHLHQGADDRFRLRSARGRGGRLEPEERSS